ncbi:MAG: TetR/AcrR family transcriptional regulator [Streptosporangiales bacterium]
MGAQLTRRETSRQTTRRDILDAARRLLAAGGPPAVSLRAVAGEIGMTAPGLYRYFPTHEELLLALTDMVMGEMDDVLEYARDGDGPAEPDARMAAVARTFRHWCVGHPHEFQLMFGLTVVPEGVPADHCNTPNCVRFGGIFFGLFVALFRRDRFPVLDESALDPDLARQLRAWTHSAGQDAPLGLVKVFLDGWVRLYGLVALELYGHMRFALDNVEALFETQMAEFLGTLRP